MAIHKPMSPSPGGEEDATVLVFGPQALSFCADDLQQLRSAASRRPAEWEWVLETIAGLPDCWEAFTDEFPQFKTHDGTRRLRHLHDWFATGVVPDDLEGLSSSPNLLLSPLVVASQIVELLEYLHTDDASDTPREEDEVDSASRLLLRVPGAFAATGLCTGILSAAAAALSENLGDLRGYAARSIRIATLIGGVVDAQGERAPAVGWKALATAWSTAETREGMQRVLAGFPEAYVSVDYDDNRATVTAPAAAIPALQSALRGVGVVASEIGLRGSFHHGSYEEDAVILSRYCGRHPAQLALPEPSHLVHPLLFRPETDDDTALHTQALQAILVEQSRWVQTFRHARDRWLHRGEGGKIVVLGPERCIPPSMLAELGSRVTHLSSVHKPGWAGVRSTKQQQHEHEYAQPGPRKADDVAIIGLSVKVAGADDADEFWDLLSEAKSQHQEVPAGRLTFESPHEGREVEPDRKWFGNFVNHHDTFDHKFFKKSAREMASADPQHRQMLQAAYQAVSQSGYFGVDAPGRDAADNVGCFIGSCTGDYENNVACHPPNAFTAVGNLRSFTAGKLSHYFGWTGPSVCLDTACSSSCVAIHQACQSILTGECGAALAGGTNIVTHSLWFQNLAAASFLSPTGQCKPFDAAADGYCRGEGVAAVFLKPMSKAIADGDQIFGTISGTAVMQNRNCTPIVVPSSPSLADLFVKVLGRAQLAPDQVGYVEAHGTGTQVGDPAEYQSIRDVVGGPGRTRTVSLGSVKGLVGHTEGASGVVSLVKSLLMLHQRAIPPQPSFETLNPHIPALPTDKIRIASEMEPWEAGDGGLRAVLINNYGASGSNASMVITESPVQRATQTQQTTRPGNAACSTLVRIEGPSDAALKRYAARLRRFLLKGEHKTHDVADVAFNVSRQCSNVLSDRVLAFSCRSTAELTNKLGEIQNGQDETAFFSPPAPRPVILCFGGQVSTSVGLDRGVYQTALVFRRHLDECDSVCRSLRVPSLFPDIFDDSPVRDIVHLQTMLFASQYASARSWIDCGVRPAALVGHSFGELTALSVSGVLTLPDALRLIAGRAAVIRDHWGVDKGAMLAVQAGQDEVDAVLAESARSGEEGASTIACINGPKSFTLAGSERSIDDLSRLIASDPRWSSVRSKKLNVTNAFHSTLVEDLKPRLRELGQQLSFKTPLIPLETATRSKPAEHFDPSYVADHMRDPVYFHQAAQRLSAQYPSAIWLEAGSDSTITNMASRALGSPPSSFFQSINIGGSGQGMQQLTNATLNLWKAGARLVPWAHHRCQTYDYAPLLVPPYQFEKSRHWMEFKVPAQKQLQDEVTAAAANPEATKGLWDFVRWKDLGRTHSLFRINTDSASYQDLVSGHVMAQTAPICPATVELDIVVEALTSVCRGPQADMQPRIQNVSNQAAICHSPRRSVWLDLEAVDDRTWNWRFTSDEKDARTPTLHASGQVVLVPASDEAANLDFAAYERLISHAHCLDLLDRADPSDDMIQGRGIYRTFSPVVDYGPAFRGLQRIVGRGNESAGRVVSASAQAAGRAGTWLDPHLSDGFCQVGGVWVNCLNDCDPKDLYLATGIGRWIRSPRMRRRPAARCWDVLAKHHVASKQTVLTDIFVFEPDGGALVEVVLGINYHKVPKASMSRLLSKLAAVPAASITRTLVEEKASSIEEDGGVFMPQGVLNGVKTPQADTIPAEAGPEKALLKVDERIRALIADISGLETTEIADDAQLADIGIDSLMGMEVARELGSLFSVSLPMEDLFAITDVRSLIDHMYGVLGLASGEGVDTDSSESKARSGGISDGHRETEDISPPSSDGGLPDSVNTNGDCGEPQLTLRIFQECFLECKGLTDTTLAELKCTDYAAVVLPEKDKLCAALAMEALEEMGCPLSTAGPGDVFPRVQTIPKQQNLADYLYLMLREAGLIALDKSVVTRTAAAAPRESSSTILDRLLRAYPDHECANRLTYFAGRRLADVLRGNCDGIQLIFGSPEGRELVAALYGDFLLNQVANAQMRDMLRRLAARMKTDGSAGPLRIMEMGAGTGGTTNEMVRVLSELDVPVQYTFTDLSGSFVAAARKRYKKYPFMEFRVHDIEKPPPEDLRGTQHVVIASNAVHATHSLVRSAGSIRKALRPDGGLLMMMEMTQPLHWVDMIFGLFEGWWLFDDGRDHAIAPVAEWETALRAAGYTHVDWTDGSSPETKLERVIVAFAAEESRYDDPLPVTSSPLSRGFDTAPPAPILTRRAVVDRFVRQYSHGFSGPEQIPRSPANALLSACVVVTGGTGSLGAHMVAHLASLAEVDSVICLNRRSATVESHTRQMRAFEQRGLSLSASAVAKIRVLEADTAAPLLGLSETAHRDLVTSVTHIVHNAWPMTSKRPLPGLEAQFRVMRNLIDLANGAASSSARGRRDKITFQFVSSIATVGHHPFRTGQALVPEERMDIDSVLTNGYGEAKFVCERMLDETLHRHPGSFRAMAVRPGQIAGSSASGYWNPQEHLAFLVKSSRSLRCLPDLRGDLRWTPVDDVARALGDLLLSPRAARPVYHVDNPAGQPWEDMVPVLAELLGVDRVVPFAEWLGRVRSFEGPPGENPAAWLVEFLEDNFLRMSCGGLLLDTARACEDSPALGSVGPVGRAVVERYIRSWKQMGFL